MNYGKSQGRAEALVSKFRELAAVEPDGMFKGRSYVQVVDEIERKTEFGRDCVYWSEPLLRAIAKGPPRNRPPTFD
jgi:hypothetical protein